jgi:dTDP-4-amino-4,6-dideoxygalactose transaminase/carbonic anhydrase/acetyltransferase-like protein (isoleucine patch superfamily)
MAGARLGADCHVGQNCFIARGVRLGDRVKLQNNVSVYEGVVLEDDVFCGPSMVFTNVRRPRAHISRKREYQSTRVGRGATLGANSTVIAGVKLGAYCLVAAGATVTHDVPAHALVMGVPARQVGWVSTSGASLDFEGDRAICPDTGERYQLIDGELRAIGPETEVRPVPFMDLAAQHEPLRGPLQAAFDGLLDTGEFILGSAVEGFERQVAGTLGVSHAVGVSSGTDALYLALHALGIGPGDEVITTPLTFVATAESIVRVGATPRFVDVEPGSLNLDPEQVEAALSPKTKAILPVHLFGSPAALEPLVSLATAKGLHLIEDAAQAFGGKLLGRALGSWGTLGCFSFFPSKPLGCLGDGGLVVTADSALAERVRSLRVHGLRSGEVAEVGGNFRLDALQARVLSVKLPHVERWQSERQAAAHRYLDALSSCEALLLPARSVPDESAWSLFTVRLREPGRRAKLLEGLR